MSNFIDLLKGFVNQDMISKASTLLGEQSSNVSSAVGSIFSSLMGVLLKYGDTAQKKNIFEEASNLDILSNAQNIFEGPSQEQQKIGDNFLQSLLGDKAADFTSAISSKSGVSKPATNRLMSMVAPIFAGFAGKMIKDNNWSMEGFRTEIKKQEKSFIDFIPTDLFKSFGLGSILGNTANSVTASASNNINRSSALGSDKTPVIKKKNYNWLLWVILGILLLLSLFWWRSCKNPKISDKVPAAIVDSLEKAKTAASGIAASAVDATVGGASAIVNAVKQELVLPNGVKLQAIAGGVEEKMIAFLESDEYKKATDADLKKKWFEFDNIEFEFGSSTNLLEGSQAHLLNIAEILKNYKNAKIKIGAYADKVGSESANKEISTARAKTIETMLSKAGVGSQIAGAEGYGAERASRSASETDNERAKDRDIALRFVK